MLFPNAAAVSIYNMKDNKSSARGVTLLHTMTNKQCTSLHWSPSGRFLLLAGLGVRLAAARCRTLAALFVVDTVRCSCCRWECACCEIVPCAPAAPASGLTQCASSAVLPHPSPLTQGGHNGVVEFWDCEEMTLLSAGEHFMAQVRVALLLCCLPPCMAAAAAASAGMRAASCMTCAG